MEERRYQDLPPRRKQTGPGSHHHHQPAGRPVGENLAKSAVAPTTCMLGFSVAPYPEEGAPIIYMLGAMAPEPQVRGHTAPIIYMLGATGRVHDPKQKRAAYCS